MKIYTNYLFNGFTHTALIAAEVAGKQVELEVVDQATKESAEFKAKNFTGKFPLLETEEGNLNETIAIAKYLADGHATFLGESNFQKAKVDQWSLWAATTVMPNLYPALRGIFGWAEVEAAVYNDAVKNLKAHVKAVNDALANTPYLTGENLTLADVIVFVFFSSAFQTILDGGFRKAMKNAGAWFDRVAANPAVIKVVGVIKPAAKAIKPATVKAAPKVEKPKKAAPAPKPAAAPKKDVNPLDALPPSSFNLYDFKTLFVNHKDKREGGMQELKNLFDPVGYSFWYVHYDKYGDEGKKLTPFVNLLKGFIQRIDHFRKHSFARMSILGEEPNLEIEGVWLWRGQDVPQEMLDHPQFEYFKRRKLDLNDEKDFALVRDHWCAEDDGQCDGRFVQLVQWHK